MVLAAVRRCTGGVPAQTVVGDGATHLFASAFEAHGQPAFTGLLRKPVQHGVLHEGLHDERGHLGIFVQQGGLHVHRVAERLERIERNADRQDDAQHGQLDVDPP